VAEPDTADRVRQLVDQAVRTAVPAAEMVQRRIRPDSDYSWPEPTPLAGVQAAQQVRRMAEQHMYRYVAGLRGEGRGWRWIADLLEIPWSDEYSRVERAFELTAAAVGHDSSWSGPRIFWYCGGPLGCGKHIADRGPYNGYPSDDETGHADGCQRLAAEDEARARENDEADRAAQVMDEAYALLSDGFDRATADRARYVTAHGGRYRGWSTSEALAVALVLGDDAELKRHGYSTPGAAIDRVFNGSANRPPNMDVWIACVRAAAIGTPIDA
jgi:hypothetical protein